MKEKQCTRLLSFVLVIAMVLSLCPTIAFAGTTLPYQGESAQGQNEPTSHGYRAEDLLSWDPATDPDAELTRARVPLQNRIEAVAATQANPSLNPEVQYLTLAGDYGNAFFGGTSYTNEFSEYCFNFWQYIDVYAPWHGQTPATTPESLWDVESEREFNGKGTPFEFGMMNLPNAAYTNAAHKNGALSLGCIFLPRAYQSWQTLIQRDEDGGFPYAEKLIEIAEYYGFDGWFVNLEGADAPSGKAKTELQAFLKTLRDAGQYIQWYDAAGSINESYLDSGAADSQFLDYGWTTEHAKEEVEKYGYGAVFGGYEAGGDRWGNRNSFSKMWSNDQVIASIASLGTDFVHHGLDEDFADKQRFRREEDEYQWMTFVRERAWFTGSSGDPTDKTISSNAEVGITNNIMPGIARMITERSVVSGDAFTTNFNTGHGLVYAQNGEISNSHEWANLNLQDILPTWQFWFETAGSKLGAEFDYGTQYQRYLEDGTPTAFDFDLVDPYEGGSSLAVYGKVDAKNFMHLYKTDLDVTSSSKLDVTFQKTSSDNVAMSLGVVLAKDIDAKTDTYTVTELPIENTTAASDGWVTATVDLSAYAGEKIAMLGLYFDGEAENYQMHIGQLKYASGKDLTPDVPTGLTIDKAYDTNEMVVSWDLGDYDTVKQYNVYAVINGVEQYMGGIYDEIYYIKNIYDAQGVVTIKVTAVGADGSESEAATATYDYSKAVTGLTVEAADGALTVSFTPADSGAATDISVYVPATGKIYTAQAAAGETSAVVDVPAGAEADGKEYEMQVTPVGGSAKAYDGELDDSYCVPYDGPMTGHKLTSPVACADWYAMDLTYTTPKGYGSDSYTRGIRSHRESNNDWAAFQLLPDSMTSLTVTLTDYKGNRSEPVTYDFISGEPVDLDGPVGATHVPDAALRTALQEQAGETYREVLAYSGPLDLSGLPVKSLEGLTLIPGITELNASGTDLTAITSDMLPKELSSLNLTDCIALVDVELKTWPDLTVTLSGCENLENLYLPGTQMTSLDISDLTKLHNFDISGSNIHTLTPAEGDDAYANAYLWDWSGSKLDLTGNTAEGALKAAMEHYFDTTEIPEEISKLESCLYAKDEPYMTISEGKYMELDMGSVQPVTKLVFADYGDWYDFYNLVEGSILTSVDGETFTTALVFGDLSPSATELVLPETVHARYVRLVMDTQMCMLSSLQVWGYGPAEQGFRYGGQRPVVVRDDVGELEVPQDGAVYQLLELLDESYAQAHTPGGNKLSALLDADWVDAEYLALESASPAGVRVSITDSQGNAYTFGSGENTLGELDTDTNVALHAGSIMVSRSSYHGSPNQLFNGNHADLWYVYGNSGWVGFVLERPAVVGQWYVAHAGMAGSMYASYNAKDYRLQALDPDSGITEEAFMAMSDVQKTLTLTNGGYWKDLDIVTDNTSSEVTREIAAENLTQAQVYRLYVDRAPSLMGMCEVELYAYTGLLGADNNGLLCADQADVYQVSYTKSKEEIASTTVTVRIPTVEEVEERINAIGTPITAESKAVIDIDRTSYDNLPADQKELVSNYGTLEAAEAAYLALADQVELLIDGIGFVTLESKEALKAARAAYDALPEELKALVANYETLLKAEQAYAYLTEVDDLLKQAGDAAAAAEAAQKAAEVAQAKAEAAQAAAEVAQAEAEKAHKAAEAAAAEAGENREAAEAAQQKAEEAQAKAETAQAAAEAAQAEAEKAQESAKTAQKAAESAAAAAEESNKAAAAEAAKAAEEAHAAAESASAAAGSAAEAAASAAEAAASATAAAEAQVKAQAAQAAAEGAARIAAEAQTKAEEALKKAEETAASSAEDKEAAEKAAAEAQAAQEAAEAAQAAAEDAQAAAQAAQEAAAQSNKEAAASAAQAAEYVQKVAEMYAEIVEIKAEMVDYLAKAQVAAEEAEEERKKAEEAQKQAEEERKKAEEAQKKAEEAALASAKYRALIELAAVDTSAYNAEQKEAAKAILAEAREAIDAAVTTEEADKALETALAALAGVEKLICASDLFTDVAQEAWYHEGVDFMVRNTYMNGVSETIFSVNGKVTRGQVVTILYRIAGMPSVEGLENPFQDVSAGKFYTNAVTWAFNEGIVMGTSETIFAPDVSITREQIAAILYRYDGENTVKEDNLSDFSDGTNVSNFAKDAMNWAVANGLINGIGTGETATLSAKTTATRSQIAVILMRYLTEG